MASASESFSSGELQKITGKPVVSVVTTTYEEEANLPTLLEELFDVFEQPEAMAEYRPYEIIVVDDPGTDGTREVIREYAEQYPEVRGIFNRRRFGQSAGLKAGIDHSRGSIVVTLDADLQNDPADIPKLLDTLEDGYDCVSGWRKDRHDSLGKKIPSRIQTPLAKLTGPDINDFGCTLKAYRGQAIRDIDLYGEGHRYIPSRLHKLGYSITEVEVNHRPRVHGESRYGIGRLLRGFADLLWHLYWVRWSSRPSHLLGVAGLVMLGVGGAVGGHATVNRLVFGAPVMEHLPRLLASVALVIVGIQLLMFSVLAEMLAKQYYQQESEYRVAEYVGFG